MSIIYPGLSYHDRKGNPIYTDFRNMIRVEQIFEDDDIPDDEKFVISVGLLYGDKLPKGMDLQEAFAELIWFYTRSEETNESDSKTNTKKLYDFEQDADYIYASFLETYNIDITDPHLKLHWWQFMALFISLPEDTIMSKRMYYRDVDTSKMKGSQKKEYEKIKKSIALKNKRKNSLKALTAEQAKQATLDRYNKRYEEAQRLIKEKGEK